MSSTLQKHPDIDCLGGKITPYFEDKKPGWAYQEIMTAWGLQNHGDSLKYLEFPDFPFGGNVSIRKAVFGKCGEFNKVLGRKRNSLLSNEEAEFFYRASQGGAKMAYTPKAEIFHRIPAHRSTPEWMIERQYWQSISDVIMQQIVSPKNRIELLHDAVSSTINALRVYTGGQAHPKRIYWHFKKWESKII
jgi:GT2 family glycosyltransferase